MKKFVVQAIALLLVIFGGLYFTYRDNSLGQALRPIALADNRQILIKDKVVNVEVADTADERKQGLSGRETLDPDSGVLFVFDRAGKYQFWMKGMKIPLDMIFIKNGTVVDFIRNVPPPAPETPDQDLKIYQSLEEFEMMLEVNAGFVEKHNINIGDKVAWVSTQ